MKRYLSVIFVFAFVFIFSCGATAMTSDDIPYVTYQYTYDGKAVATPHAYIPRESFSIEQLGTIPMKDPSDLKISTDGNLYISDSGNNRIVVINSDLTLSRMIEHFENEGKEDGFSNPSGLFVTERGHLYICDQSNHRIIELDKNDKLVRIISKPADDLLPENYNFSPSHIAVDGWGRIYTVVAGTTYGIMEFSAEGVFRSFAGVSKVNLSLSARIWRSVFTKEQISRSFVATPVSFSNIAIDSEGFFYATSEHPNLPAVSNAIKTRDTNGELLPVRRFNFNGMDILNRNGWYPPAGDVSFPMVDTTGTIGILGPSTITGITLGENGTYYLADSKRNKIFAYDIEGNLLYAFGGAGTSKGMFRVLKSIAYHDGGLFALDAVGGTITSFSSTDYGTLVHNTIALSANREFDKAADGWKEILKENNNFNLAYQGLGDSALRIGKNSEAMKYYKEANDTIGYSKAFIRYRKDIITRYVYVIPFAAAAVIAAIYFLFKGAAKRNKRSVKGKRNLIDHLSYSFYVIFRPFDGFWDIRHENRGSLAGAAILLALAGVSVSLRSMLGGFLVNGGRTPSNPILTLAVMTGAVAIFCVSNWCLTSLTDGKGSMGDIFITVGYSVTPLILLSVPLGLLSNILSLQEMGFVTVLSTMAYIWTGLLLFFGIMTTHQYTLPKNVLSVILTLVGVVVIVFIGFLIINLFGRIVSFGGNIRSELSLR